MPDVTQPVRARVRVWIQAQPLCDIPLRGQRRRPTQGHSCFPSQTCPLPQAELFLLIPGRQWGPNQWGLIGPSSQALDGSPPLLHLPSRCPLTRLTWNKTKLHVFPTLPQPTYQTQGFCGGGIPLSRLVSPRRTQRA